VRRCTLAFAVLLFAGAIYAADEAPVVARIVDSSLERIPLQTIAPEYPRKARRDRIEGEVTVCFEVDRSGRIRRAAVRHSSHRIFEKPSLRAVRASTFRALAEDEPVPAIKSCRTFIFALQPAKSAEP
jgi:TonB family protein